MALLLSATLKTARVRPPAAPWLRPPLRSLRWVEGFLEALAAFGAQASQLEEIGRRLSVTRERMWSALEPVL